MTGAIAAKARGYTAAGAIADALAALAAADSALTSSVSSISSSLINKANLSGGNSWYGTQAFLDNNDFTRVSINSQTGVITGVGSGLTALNGSNISSGAVGITYGGTGQTTAAAGFNALAPTTTLGDLIYRGASGNVRLAGNTTTAMQVLTQTGTGSVSAAPVWTTASTANSNSTIVLRDGSGNINGNTITGAGNVVTTFSFQNTNATFQVGGNELLMLNNYNFSWTNSSSSIFGTRDTGINRNAAGVVEINTGTKGTFADLKCRAIDATTTISPGAYTVATLPTAGTTRRLAFASNGRKNGEGAGSGTGVLVFDDGVAWRAVDTGATVAA